MRNMHFLKLFLTASFAVAAALRGGVTVLAGASVSSSHLPQVLVGTSGIAFETVVSLALGGILAARLSSAHGRKAKRR